MVGDILRPLFQCDDSMVKSGLCTKKQLQYGKEELLDHMTHLFERNSESVVVEDDDATERINKWRNIKDTIYGGSQTNMKFK